MKKTKIELQVVAAFAATMLTFLVSCANNSDSAKNVPEELTKYNAKEVLGEDYKQRDTIKIPSGIIRIEKSAFYGCDAVSIIIPSTVTSIGNSEWVGIGDNHGVFEYCANLRSIEIPESVTSIGDRAFANCKNLETVTLKEGLNIIKDYAFYSCASLEEMTIPQSVTSIGKYAFAYCSSLKMCSLPEDITAIGKATFNNCTSLAEIRIPENVKIIDEDSFASCTSLEEITIPEGVTLIGHYAFNKCKNLKEATLPKSLTEVQTNAFDNCSSLTSVTILADTPPQISTISYSQLHTFYGNRNMKFYVPENSVEAYKTQWSQFKDKIEAI